MTTGPRCQGTLLVYITIATTFTMVTTQNMKDVYFESLIDFLYDNYPDFVSRLLTYNGTKLGNDVVVSNSTAYKNDYVLETKFQRGGYGVFISNAFRYQFANGLFSSSHFPHNVMYKCESAIRYCGGNPAYCRYNEGERGTQIIIFAGHDGPLTPKGIPDRRLGCWNPNIEKCIYRHDCEDIENNILKNAQKCGVVSQDDVATTDIAVYMADKLRELTKKRPHLIVSRIHRKKLDVNRPLPLATFHVPEAVAVYQEVHGFIKQAKASMNGKWGIILDIHGNALPEKWTMLGYGVLKYQFDNDHFSAYDSTLIKLAQRVRRVNVTIDSLLRGKNSLGYLMEERGIKVIPSPHNPSPQNNSYLTGGYITRHHGSRNGGNVDAIQIEIPVNDRDTKEQKETYLNHLCGAIVDFIDMNYNKRGGRRKA